MTTKAITPEPILQTVAGLWAAGVLKSGVDLHLFDHIHAGTHEVAALSAAVGGDPQALRILLDALVALGLLGTEAVLTGMRADVARQIVELGGDLGGIKTLATLQHGVRYALARPQRGAAARDRRARG